MRLRVVDMFCGAGGSSTGFARAAEAHGVELELTAVNHWPVAIATHTLNHPDARHFCSNVYRLAPREAVPAGELDLLMASPTCTFHSRARGGKPISRQQRYGRMTPTQVLRWAAELRPRCLIVENVPEFVDWGPVHPAAPTARRCRAARCKAEKPCRARRGAYFRPWLRRLRELGYQVEWRVLNAADFGDATTRQRFFLLGRRDGKPIRWPAPTHSRQGSPDLFGAGARRWRAAREVIDWSLEGQSIFTRKRPLSPKTIARIYAGAVKFGWPEPFLVVLRQHMAGRSLDEPLPTLTAGGTHAGLAQPLLFQVNQGGDRARNIRPASEPMQTVVTRPSLGVAEPVVLRSDMHKSHAGCFRSQDEPLATLTTRGGIGVAEAVILPQRDSNRPRGANEPVAGITTIGLAQPFLLNRHGDNGATRAHSLEAPVPTADCRGAGYVVEPFVLSQGAGGAPREASAPMPTIPGKGAHALIAPYYGQSDARPASEPLGTVTTRDRFALVVPVTHDDQANRARSPEEPLPSVTGARRGELAFIAAAFGERKGQAPRVHSLEDPAPTLCATGRIQLVEGFELDIRFRMLQPHELAAAMGLEGYKFVGTKEEVTKQIGNAVARRTATALFVAVMLDERASEVA